MRVYVFGVKKLRRLSNKLDLELQKAELMLYGLRLTLSSGEVLYRDKKGWLHAQPPLTPTVNAQEQPHV